MRLNLFVTCAAITAVVIAVTFLLTADLTPYREEADAPMPGALRELAPETGEYEYILREYEGRLAVFFPGREQPQKIFDVYVSTLPEYDRGQLSQGIPVKDYRALLRRIEDFAS